MVSPNLRVPLPHVFRFRSRSPPPRRRLLLKLRCVSGPRVTAALSLNPEIELSLPTGCPIRDSRLKIPWLTRYPPSTHRLRRHPSTLASPRRTKLSIATPVTTSFTSACPLLPGVIDGTNQRLPQITPIACWFLSQNADKLLSSLRPLCSSFSTSQVQSAER